MSDDKLAADAATTTMISLVGSLIDNKTALGRRYGEWAISAPSVEEAVALAAMAQDELGHARATYGVLAKMGFERDEQSFRSGSPLPLLADELPDWSSVIAANAIVDAILTTFVAAVRDSSIEPLAQRAQKILQEEGAHRVHAEAWLKRIREAGGQDAAKLTERMAEFWPQAARWPGPGQHPGWQQALTEGMVGMRPDGIRGAVRDWLVDNAHSAGLELILDNPTDWSGWDESTRQ